MEDIINAITSAFDGGFEISQIQDFFVSLGDKVPFLKTIIDAITGLIGNLPS